MRRFTRSLSAGILAATALAASGAQAADVGARAEAGEKTPSPATTLTVPNTIAFQGYLTDTETGDPIDARVTLDVGLYLDDVGGTAAWSERHTDVTVASGVFAIPLGAFAPLSLSLFSGAPLWLGISVNGETEMAPRTPLRSAPFAMRAAVADSAVAVGAADDGDWAMNGNDLSSGVPGNVGVGTATPAEKLDVVGEIRVESSEFDALRVTRIGMPDHATLGYNGGFSGDEGGALFLRDEFGGQLAYMGPGFGPESAVLYLTGPSFNGIAGDSDWDGLGNPVFYLTGNSGGHQFDTGAIGDDATFLPDASVSAMEMLNEPGISNMSVPGSINVFSSTMTDIAVTTIDIPTAGYIVVEAQAQAGLSNTTAGNWMDFQIDELSGGGGPAAALPARRNVEPAESRAALPARLVPARLLQDRGRVLHLPARGVGRLGKRKQVHVRLEDHGDLLPDRVRIGLDGGESGRRARVP